MNLEETIKKCQAGNMQAFRDLFCYIEKKALGTAYLISGKKGLAEDIVQESFVRCLEQINTLKNPKAFNVWFYRIITHIGWKMVKNYSSIDSDGLEDSMSPFDLEEHVEIQIINKRLLKAVNELSDNLKTVIILYYFNGMSVEEISKITQSLKATVKTRLFYARSLLREKLKDYVLVNSDGKEDIVKLSF